MSELIKNQMIITNGNKITHSMTDYFNRNKVTHTMTDDNSRNKVTHTMTDDNSRNDIIVAVTTKRQIIFPFSEITTQNNGNKSSFEREIEKVGV